MKNGNESVLEDDFLLVHAYLDSELDPADALVVGRKIAANPALSAELALIPPIYAERPRRGRWVDSGIARRLPLEAQAAGGMDDLPMMGRPQIFPAERALHIARASAGPSQDTRDRRLSDLDALPDQ